MKYKHLVFGIILACLGQSGAVLAEENDTIIFWGRISDNPVIFQILGTILDKTVDQYGPYRLEPSLPMQQSRAIVELKKNLLLNIANFAPSDRRESELIPVRIPVTRGLLGYRVCLIKKGDQSRFNHIQNLDDWRDSNLAIGQLSEWPDTDILYAHDLEVEEGPKYQLLFDMLVNRRFDCFSRSITEVMPELEKYAGMGIELEEHLLFIYPLPSFFFVSKLNPRLAERIQAGFEIAIADGSYDRIITGEYQNHFEKMHLGERTRIFLSNDSLSSKTNQVLDEFAIVHRLEDFLRE